MNHRESIAEDAALEWFGELGHALDQRPHMEPLEPAVDGVFGLPPRISIHSTPNLDLSTPNLSCDSSVLLANSYDSRKAIP